MTTDRALAGKRIVMVMGGFEMGGTERQVTQLARHLARDQGAEVQVTAFGDVGLAAERLTAQGIAWSVTPNPWRGSRMTRPGKLLAFARTLRAAHPDVLLSYTLPPNLACALVWRRTGAATCIWNQRDAGIHRGRRITEHAAVRRVPAFASNSAAGVEFLTDALDVPPGRIAIVPNAVELPPPSVSRATWRAGHGVAHDDLVVAMLANLTSSKDQPTLLKAWRRVLDDERLERPPFLLLVGAAGDAHEAVERAIADLSLADSIRLTGPVDDVASLLGAIDVAVYSSRCEGCPNGVLEPMAAGLPVVATDTPGVRNALGGIETLAPAGDDAALADHLVQLLADPIRRRQAGDANRQTIDRRPSPLEAYRVMTRLIAEQLHSGP